MARKKWISPPIDDHELPKWRELLCRFVNGLKSPEDWKLATLVNGWSNVGGNHSPFRYHKDDMGYVHVHGEIGGGTYTSGTIVTTLPVGYRPEYEEHIFIEDHTPPTKIAYATIETNGNIKVYDLTTNTHIAFYIMSFRAYQ
jgi:hypothetical protein